MNTIIDNLSSLSPIIIVACIIVLMIFSILNYRRDQLQEEYIKANYERSTSDLQLPFNELMSIVDSVLEQTFDFNNKLKFNTGDYIFDFDKELYRLVREVSSSLSVRIYNNMSIYTSSRYLTDYITKHCELYLIEKVKSIKK